MSRDEKAARFQHFARMRLEGRSDILYRAYDLLTTERLPGDIDLYLRAAGFVRGISAREHLTTLQHRFMKWGFPVMTLSAIEVLLHEYWVYDRLKNRGKKGWPYRDPDDARRLYEENEAALKRLRTPPAASSPARR